MYIASFDINTFTCREEKRQLAAFLSFFQFNMESDNSSLTWDCDCTLYYLQRFIMEEAEDIIRPAVYEGSFIFRNINFQSWKCRVNPILEPGMHIAPFLEMPAEKFICPNNDTVCPQNCMCYRGAKSLDIFVDCSHLNLVVMPKHVPVPDEGGKLLVNLANNNIRRYASCGINSGYDWLKKVTTLDLEHNEITPNNSYDTNNFLQCLKKVEYLYLAYNNIDYLPQSIQYIDYTNLSISGNKLKCDCTTSWMKQWLQKKKSTIQRSQSIHCLQKGKVKFILVFCIQRFNCSR